MANATGKKTSHIYLHTMMEFLPSEADADISKQNNSSQTPIAD